MNNILADTEKYVTSLFAQNNNDKLHYHNIVHTKSVVKAAELIGGKCEHGDGDINALLVAAWFHDVGYLETQLDHEEVSKRFAREFLLPGAIIFKSINLKTSRTPVLLLPLFIQRPET